MNEVIGGLFLGGGITIIDILGASQKILSTVPYKKVGFDANRTGCIEVGITSAFSAISFKQVH